MSETLMVAEEEATRKRRQAEQEALSAAMEMYAKAYEKLLNRQLKDQLGIKGKLDASQKITHAHVSGCTVFSNNKEEAQKVAKALSESLNGKTEKRDKFFEYLAKHGVDVEIKYETHNGITAPVVTVDCPISQIPSHLKAFEKEYAKEATKETTKEATKETTKEATKENKKESIFARASRAQKEAEREAKKQEKAAAKEKKKAPKSKGAR